MNQNIKFQEIVGLFDDDDSMQAAIDDLGLSHHFKRQDISVIGDETAIEKKFAKFDTNSSTLADNISTPRGTNVTPEEKGVGTGVVIGASILVGVVAAWLKIGKTEAISEVISAVIVGGVIGGVGGILLILLIRYATNRRLQKRIDKGGLVLWVRIKGKDSQKIAREILKKHGAHSIHTCKR